MQKGTPERVLFERQEEIYGCLPSGRIGMRYPAAWYNSASSMSVICRKYSIKRGIKKAFKALFTPPLNIIQVNVTKFKVLN
jgi:hypothetical protein